MDPLNFSLIFLGGGLCALVLIGILGMRRAIRAKPLSVRLMVWVAAGLVGFGGSQILGKGLVGWWPCLGSPDVFVRLVKVKVSPASGRIALVAFAGFKGQATQSAASLFVADRDGHDIVEVCGGLVMDVRWSRDGEQLYVLRGASGHPKGSRKSLWRYTPSNGNLAYVRDLSRLTTGLSLDPAERSLLFDGPLAEGEQKFLLVRGQVNHGEDDQPVCWRAGWLGGHTWGPKTGNMFIATNEASSFGEKHGLWRVKAEQDGAFQPESLVEMQGIEGISLNTAETCAALFVRRWPPPCIDFDLYVLNLKDGLATPIAPAVEWDSAVWDRKGEKLAFADSDGLKTYDVSTGRVRLLLEARPSWVDPNLRERLRPLSYSPSGDIVFQAGLWRVEKYDGKTGDAKTLFHRGQLRRYFKG